MRPLAVLGVPSVDAGLAHVPQLLSTISPYDRRLGYKSWKVPSLGRPKNWFQWNDGDVQLRISFPNEEGLRRVWKVFARFETRPASGLWDRPQRYERILAQWMPAGSDVWGIAYEDLEQLDDLSEVARALVADAELSFRYAISRYRN